MNYKGNPNSAVNQRIIGKLVEREVFCCVSTLVDAAQSSDPDLFAEDCDNYYRYVTPCGKEFSDDSEELDERIKWLEEAIEYLEDRSEHLSDRIDGLEEEIEDLYSCAADNLKDKHLGINVKIKRITLIKEAIDEKLGDLQENLEDLQAAEYEPQEVLEWWAVSNWFAEKLKDKGCVVCDTGSVLVWGRCTSGQAILLDGVICEIAADLEILEGQERSWAE